MKKTVLLALLVILFSSGCSVQRSEKQYTELQDQFEAEQDVTVQQEDKIQALAEEVENLKKNSEVNETENVIADYKTDLAEWKEIRDFLGDIYSNPEKWCPDAVATRYTKTQSFWWFIVENLTRLNKDYGSYNIEYIDNSLNGYWGAVRDVQDKCAEIGFDIR